MSGKFFQNGANKMNEEETINKTSDSECSETNWTVEVDNKWAGLEQTPSQILAHLKPESMSQITSLILTHLKPESASQAISLILAHLKPESASQVIKQLDLNIQLDVVKRIGCMEYITPGEFKLFYACLKAAISSMSDVSKIGGSKLAADILKHMDHNAEPQLMERLKEEDPELAGEIKDLMLLFEDLKYVDQRGIQKVISAIGTDLDLITYALKAASDEVKEVFLRSLSPTARSTVEDDIQYTKIPIREAMDMQQKILGEAARLIENGEIVVHRYGEEQMLI